MTVSAVKFLQPAEIQGLPTDDTPLLVLAQAGELFKDRAARLDYLSTLNGQSPWLKFCAQLAHAQSQCLSSVPQTILPVDLAQKSLTHNIPPLSITSWVPGSDWDVAFGELCRALEKEDLPASVQKVLVRLRKLNTAELVQQARDLIDANEAKVTPEFAPFLGATLQVMWTKNTEQLQPFLSLHKGESALCPVCGSHPVASVVRTGEADGHRYLVCSLCATQWYGPRARCTNCDSPKEVSLFGETRESFVQGECCDDCHGYLKIMVQSKEPTMEVVADDLASLKLDLALAAEGFQRTGRNLFFITGAS